MRVQERTCVGQNAFSTQLKRKWILGKCSGGVLIIAALGADQDRFFITDTKTLISIYALVHTSQQITLMQWWWWWGGGSFLLIQI